MEQPRTEPRRTTSHTRTLGVMALVVLALGALAWWQLRIAGEQERSVADRALLEGFDMARVGALRVDNLERSLQMRIEREGEGSWRIVDPLDFPADPVLVTAILESLATQRAAPVADPDPKKLGFAPPRAVLEVVEEVAGKPLERRIEIGQVDYDGQSVFVKSEGVFARTSRAIDTLLERDLPEWRSRRVLTLALRDVFELHRAGRSGPGDGGEDLTLDAVFDGGEWRATSPFQARLDPEAAARMVVSALALQAQSFHDAGGPLSAYGLDRPRLRLDLATAAGAKQTLLLTPERGELWYANREGEPHVVSVMAGDLDPMSAPFAALVDRQLARAPRERTTRIVLAGGDRETVLTRSGKQWRLKGTVGGVEVISDEPADAALVEDALGVLERALFDELLLGETFAEPERSGAIRIELDGGDLGGGEVEGGSFGPPLVSAGGATGLRFRRDADGMVGVVHPSLHELASRNPGSWRSLDLHKVPEIEVSYVELSSGGTTRSFTREEKGKWVRSGTTLEAKDFARLVDPLLAMRAEEVLARGEDSPERPMHVRIVGYTGSATEFDLGDWKAPSGETWTVYRGPERFARIRPELLESLRATLAGE